MLKALDLWLPSWIGRDRNPPRPLGMVHVLLAICDHFEPLQGTGRFGILTCIKSWRSRFRERFDDCRDATGRSPRHTFFYPIEQYDPTVLEALAETASEIDGEIELQLHHENDSRDKLRATLETGCARYREHGLLSQDDTGRVRFGFIHGDSALDHSHPRGLHCGVPDEIGVLREAGCYGDFTLPSAPEPTQTRTINSIYYAREDGTARSHETGRPLIADRQLNGARDNELLIVQGPLGLDWSRRKFGLLPRIENSEVTAANPPSLKRFKLWLECRITVSGRPNWIFVKLHTHSAEPRNTEMLLGEEMKLFHASLAVYAERMQNLRYHYVTAREMVNIIHAAEAGHSGDPSQFRDFRYRR